MANINFLPPWVETNEQPAFYDKESGTVLQQTARMYAKVNQLVRSVNEQNETITDYIQQFIDLHDYVEDYFTNLDVQEEVNNKIEAMSDSGELLAIMKPYIDPIFEAQNDRIDIIDDKVDNAVSGAPAGVYATVEDLETDDPDHDRIYVVRSDGYWYYYDGDSWEQGGVYQSALTDNDVEMIDERIREISEPSDNLFDITKLLNVTGATMENGVVSCTAINLSTKYGVSGDTLITPDGTSMQFYCSFDAYTDQNASSSGRGIGITVEYTDETTSGASLLNSASSWTHFTLYSKTHDTAPISKIYFTSGPGQANIWHIKNLCFYMGSKQPRDYEPYLTAKDRVARKDIDDIEAQIASLEAGSSIDKIYGIKIATDGTVTRTQNAVGKTNDYIIGDTMHGSGTNDFDSIFPWSDIKLCNIKTDYDGTEHIYYEDDDDFARDGSNGEVFVEIPKFYTRRYFDEDGADNIEISGIKRSGFVLEPAFTDSVTGEEIEHIYVGAYLANINGGKLHSVSGSFPLSHMTIPTMKQNSGEIYDFVTLQALQKLIMIEFGEINLSPILGGLSDMVWSSCKARETATGVNTAIFGGATYINSLVVGSTIGVGDTFGELQNRTVTAIEEVDSNVRRITFDGDPVDVTYDVTYIYSTGQKSGVCDDLTYHTGRVNTVAGQSMQNQFIYRNIEGLWGNLGEYIEGITVKGLRAYWSNIRANYGDITKCKKINFALPEQNTYINSVDAKPQQIKKMGLDFHSPEIMLPQELATYDNTYYGDSFFSLYDKNQEGQDINPDTEYCGISSMAWDGKQYNGPFTLRFWVHTDGNLGMLYSTRLIKRH